MATAEESESNPGSGAARRGLIAAAAVAGLGLAVTAAASRHAPAQTLSQPLSDDAKLQHLLRRAGFGASPAELPEYQRLGLQGTVDRLLGYEQVDNSALGRRLDRLGLDLATLAGLQRWWLLRMVYSARPLEEKLTLFWHGLLTSAATKVRPPDLLVQNQFLRKNALGRFPDLLKGISRDPAMMIWLDLQTNRKGHANENYARELMELFSLGIGNYTEQDVREAARAYTGWSLKQDILPKLFPHEFVMNKTQHDEGQKTFLGRTGNLDGDDVVDAIVQKPESAIFITERLFAFFAYPDPADDVLQPLVDAYTASGYSIGALVRAILTSDAFYSPRAYRALVKSPVELVAGTARALGLETDGALLGRAASLMGQQLFNPPNVAGWPGGAAWLTSGTWLARLNFANDVVAATFTRPGPLAKPPATYAGALDVDALAAGSPSATADRLVALLLDGQLDALQRQVLVDYLTPSASPSRAWLDERRRGALYLALALPEYHLA